MNTKTTLPTARPGYRLAYHWLKDDLRAGSGDEPPWAVGEERSLKKARLCKYGYHSSPTLLDGLPYAPGSVACLVEVSEPVRSEINKQVSLSRKLLAAVNVARELRLWGCDCAERALLRERAQGREPDPRSWEAIAVSRRYANDQATDEELTAARAAARAAAGDAAGAAEIAWQKQRFDELVTARLNKRLSQGGEAPAELTQ
jgi:hypothetical protein